MTARGRDRRRAPTVCQRCGGPLALIGSGNIGVRILKCPTCGTMDRRLPQERRSAIAPLEARPFWTEWAGPVVIALEVLVLALLVAGLLISRWGWK